MQLEILNPRNQERFYLCKVAGRAMIHSRWFAHSELTEMDTSLKQKIKRFDSNYDNHMNLKFLNSTRFVIDDWVDEQPEDSFLEACESLPVGKHSNRRSEKFSRFIQRTFLNSDLQYINFDQNTLKVDRVVSCSEMFDIIHPKKAGKIMSKWSDSIVKVVQILINFRYEKVSSYLIRVLVF